MTCRRALATGVGSAVLLIALGATASSAYAAPAAAPAPATAPAPAAAGSAPATAATPAPSAAQLQEAAAQVQAAQQRLAQVQLQAEQAAEAYNGAQVKAAAAASARAAAAAALITAQHNADLTRKAAADAAVASAAAAAAADAAEADSIQAAAAVQAAQDQLDGLLSGAYRSGGTLPMYSALLSTDPLAFATGQRMLDVAGQRQRDIVDELRQAKSGADAASGRAANAEKLATAQAEQAAQRAQEAQAAQSAAQAAATASAAAAATADLAASAAASAKQHAQDMVAAAQRGLGSASSNVQGLQAAADTARRDATDVLIGSGGSVSAPSPAAAAAIAWAFREIGVPYAWGGGNASGPTLGFAQGAGTVGFDCSGLTQFAYAHAGISLDHFTGSQWNQGLRVPNREALLPGDLVFFATDTADPLTIHHVALYIGNGLMIQAPHTGDVVRVSPVWRGDFIGGVRPAP